ncbi:MAG: hypothetical protein IKO41_11385 [Lachnospiraceae bacterium]|nr:hypothetical protein [Lachnospiraceae bacterium]
MQKNTVAGETLSAIGRATKKAKAVSNYNPDKLLELINKGLSAQEICRELNIKHLQVLKSHVLKLIHSRKIFIDVPGLFMKSSKQAYVNKNGEIKICMNNIDLKGIELIPNLTEFSVFVEGDRIILEKAGSARAKTGQQPQGVNAVGTTE